MSLANSRFLYRRMKRHSSMTDENHLGRNLSIQPYKLEGSMQRLFSSYLLSDNPLTSMLSERGAEMEIPNSSWTWQLRGASLRPCVVVEDRTGENSTYQEGEVIPLVLDEPFWKAGDIIGPGTDNKRYQFRVQYDPVQQGKGHLYQLRLNTTSGSGLTVSANYFTPGTRWTKYNAQYEEGSEQGGSTQYAQPLHLVSRLSTYRKEQKITGDVHNDVLAVKLPDSEGNTYDMWLPYAEAEFWQQWYREKEIGYWTSHMSDVPGSTGRPIYSGPGVQQILNEDAEQIFYTDLTADLIEEALLGVVHGRVSPGSQREYFGFAGEFAMRDFHRAVNSKANDSGFVQNVNFVQDSDAEYHSNAMSFGYQFNKYKMANGVTLTLIHNPLYDDRQLNLEYAADGAPTSSKRITILDLAGEGMESNVKLVKKKGGFSNWYTGGAVGPAGPITDGSLASHGGDYYTSYVKDQCGVHINDPTRCLEFVYNGALAASS